MNMTECELQEMVKKQVADLLGPQLDWAVASALGMLGSDDDEEAVRGKLYWCGTAFEALRGMPQHYIGPSQIDPDTGYHFGWFRPSTDWGHGGPLWQKHVCDLSHNGDDWVVGVLHYNQLGDPDIICGWHPESHLIAFCRAFVTAKLGDVVEVPEVYC